MRLYPYLNVLYISELGVEVRWWRGHGVFGVGYFRSMRVVCYYLGVSRNCNVVLLVKLKVVPGVVDGGRWDAGRKWNLLPSV